MDQPSQPLVEVTVVADDSRVRTALAALVKATPGLVVGRLLNATQASSDLQGSDRIVLFDLDSTPPALLDAVSAAGAPLVGIGNAPIRANPAVTFVDKGAPTDAITAALRQAAAYVIRPNREASNVSAQHRPTTDAATVPEGGRSEPR